MSEDPDRAAAREELEQVRQDFRQLITRASVPDLQRPSDRTRWTNGQLLFHMLLGYLVTRALLEVVRAFGRLPRWASRTFAWLLDGARRPFHLVNYLGSCAGARIIPPARMPGVLDRVTAALERSLGRETRAGLRRGMHYPTTWDPFFTGYMTLADLYRYPTLHYRFHRKQLTLPETKPAA